MPDAIVNPTPRARYQASVNNIKVHRDIFGSAATQAALDTALLEYQLQLVIGTKDANGAAASHFKLAGANEFAHLLKTFAEKPASLPTQPDRDNLKS